MCDIHEKVTNQILDALKNQGPIPWRNSWLAHENAGYPMNVLSNFPYRGVNVILLQMEANERGYLSKWWATPSAWKFRGCPVKANQAGTEVCLQDKKGLRCEALFNAEQCEGADRYLVTDFGVGLTNWDAADEVIAATRADIRHVPGTQAAYFRLPKDYIIVPLKEQFVEGGYGVIAYYGTIFHELVHWSEHRLGWFANPALPLAPRYTIGELRAELGACFMAGQLRVPPPNSFAHFLQFVGKWEKVMSADHTAIFDIAAAASDAVDFILSFSQRSQPATKKKGLVTA